MKIGEFDLRYRIKKLKVDNDGIIDIPAGYIPFNYRGYFVPIATTYTTKRIKYIILLEPVNETLESQEKDIENICFFCELRTTRDKIGIRHICAICLSQLYKIAKESHKSSEC